MLRTGQLLKNGVIEIVSRVGAGGIGEVYRAFMLYEGVRKQVAIKCFNPKRIQLASLDVIEVVHRENLAISRIQHPNIVRILEVNLDSTLPFIVEEYLEGGDLAQRIASRLKHKEPGKPLFSPLELVSIGQQVCAGLMILHEGNQYHGDLKPQNICLRLADRFDVVIVDFGHAGFIEDNLLERNEYAATLAYIPPERTGFVRTASDGNSDLYSLGITLYEAVVGRPPFMGAKGREIINRLLYEVPKPLCEIFPDFPPALSDIISKLLRKNPQDRYHSAFGLSADFERCLRELERGHALAGFALGSKDKLRELNYRIPVIGRDQEMSRLRQMFEKVGDGEAELILIGAPSGTGKSRLAFEVLHRARKKSAYISYAKFSEYERNLPLSAISLLLVEHAHYLKTRGPGELQDWQNVIKEVLGARGRMIAERFPCYDGLLPEFPQPSAHEGEANFQIFNECLGEFLGWLAASGEIQLILLDDLQWADRQSIQVLGALANALWNRRFKSIAFMGTYRSNEVDDDHALNRIVLQHCPPQSLMELGPLERGDSGRLVEILLEEQGPEIRKLQDVTYRFTAGNPFYIYEYLKSSIHTGVYAFDEESKAWFFHEERIHQASLSTGVAALVSDRIRLLKPIDQALIALASLAGQAMSRRALTAILPILLETRGLSESWAEIKDKVQYIELAYQELLQKNLLSPDQQVFRFFHDKIQEAAYGTLSEKERSCLHPAYGLWYARDLEESKDRINDAHVFEAAYHLCKADGKALDPFSCGFLVNAAKLAQNAYAYDKAKEYLSAVIAAHEAQDVFNPADRFEALELLANTLTISDQVKEALKLYDKLLDFDCNPLQRASILCKKSEFSLSVLDFRQARDASVAGLEALGASYLVRTLSSSLYLLFFLPILAFYAVYFHFFGRSTKEMNDETEALRFQLQLKNQLSQHMVRPVVAIANLALVTFELMPYKECYARTTVFCYWGVVLGPFGLDRLSAKFLARAYEYFDRTADPVSKGYVLYFWGFLCDFPAGKLADAQKKLEEAISILEPIGESFWRSMSIVGLMALDYFGSESGQAGVRSHELIEQWKRLRFEPTGLAFTLRYFLENGREDQLQYYLNLSLQGATRSHHEGFDSVEALMAWLCMGEYHELKGNYETALEYVRHASWLGASRLHRSGTITYAPIVMARVLIHQKRHREALTPLLACWFNQLMNLSILRPQTLMVSGYWLDSVGWKKTGQRLIESGIRYASERHWGSVAAEGRLLLGRLMETTWQEMALVNLRLAKEYFQEREWKFHAALCNQELIRQTTLHNERDQSGSDLNRSSTLTTKRGVGIRQKIEIKSLFDVLIKLSAISQKDPLFQALMESLCHATGSELALLFFKEGEQWIPKVGYNLEAKSGDQFNNRVDIAFVDQCTAAEIREPLIRPATDDAGDRTQTSGSALMVPLIYEARIYGYCYLANTQIYELYDSQSVEIAVPIAIQATIAMQNISLNNELAVERDQLSELHQTLEHRVLEQTRDVKSIMQNINMGICTISSADFLIDKDYSLFLEKLFRESSLQGKPFLPLLLSHSQMGEDEKDQVKNMLRASMNELEMAFVVNDHILPRTLRGNYEGVPFVLELEWIPILNEGNRVDKILVTINDVTALRELEEQANQKDREMNIAIEILGCRHREWAIFMSSCQKLLDLNAEQVEAFNSGTQNEIFLRKIFVNLHTIKGNARALGLKLMSESIHEIEQYFSDTMHNPSEIIRIPLIQEKQAEVVRIVSIYREIAEQRLGRTNQNSEMISLNRERLLEFYGVIQAAGSQGLVSAKLTKSLEDIRETLFLSVEAIFRQLSLGIETLAIDLGKAKPRVEIHTPKVWATDQGHEVLRNSFVHLIRNSMDHGIETPDERMKRGKIPEGTITIETTVREDWLDIQISDDGCGLNLNKIATIGIQRGLIPQGQVWGDEAVAALIFAADVSTAVAVTDISGRGVGMTAVAQYVQEVGGSIHVEFLSQAKDINGCRPFAFLLSLPLSLFQAEPRNVLQAAGY